MVLVTYDLQLDAVCVKIPLPGTAFCWRQIFSLIYRSIEDSTVRRVNWEKDN